MQTFQRTGFLTASVLSNLWNLPLASVFQVPGVEFHAYQLGALGALTGAREAKQIRQNHLERSKCRDRTLFRRNES